MQGYNQVLIGGYPGGGLTTDKKPMMLANEAFSNLQNAYIWRDRVKKREGSVNMGRLTLIIAATSIGTVNKVAGVWTVNLFSSVSPAITETYAQLKPGSVTIVITSGARTLTLTDDGLGSLVSVGPITGATNANPCVITSVGYVLSTGNTIKISGVGGMTQLNGNTYTVTTIGPNTFSINVNSTAFGVYTTGGTWTGVVTSNFGSINYSTSVASITTTLANGSPATAAFTYFPGLPVMGILKQDVADIGIDQTIYFDTKYAYQFVSGNFQQLASATPTTWTGTNTNFFWAANYQGADPSFKYFFETNFNLDITNTKYDPIRYYNNTTWTALQPLITATTTLWQGLLIVPYYGRLCIFNTWEGTTAGTYTGASNFSARCRFSQIGNPIDVDAFRQDIFGRGGFIDAPTNESIVSAAFFRNTLIVFFEYSTWQLRYIGEYGLPFIFERISSDFGAVSTYSSIVFDQGVMTVSDRGVIQASAGGLQRLDEQIPETIFSFKIQDNAPNFVHGIRDFEKEVVYWNYVDEPNKGLYQDYPNTVLLFNYRNNTWAQFRDTITCFGPGQFQLGITWDSLTTFWDSQVSWDNVDDQNYVDYVTYGNQQGFISIYENQDAATNIPSPIIYGPSLFIYAIDLTTNPITFTSPSHNFKTGEIIYISETLWNGSDPGLNDALYQVKVISADTFGLREWNGENYINVTSSSLSTYIGNGLISLCPLMNIVGKDFNPYQSKGKQFKVSAIDFLMDTNNNYPGIQAVTVQLFVNSYLSQANLQIFNNQAVANSSLKSGIIQFADRTNPCEITSKDHSLRTGELIYIANVVGMTQINQLQFNITVIDANTFSLDGIDATGYTTYVKGGVWNTVNAEGPTYLQGAEYAWYSFYSNQFGQFLRIGMTYDDALMNEISTHQVPMQLHAMNIYFREGGRISN